MRKYGIYHAQWALPISSCLLAVSTSPHTDLMPGLAVALVIKVGGLAGILSGWGSRHLLGPGIRGLGVFWVGWVL